MTLSLYVLRHAKAEEAAATGGDHARALRGRGRKAARLVGGALARLDEAPELILSSTALRARETAELVREAARVGAPVELSRDIYEATSAQLLARLTALRTSARRVLLVGHQPGLGLLIAELTGGEPELPTTALARIDFELEAWEELGPRSGHLVWLVTVELLTGLGLGD